MWKKGNPTHENIIFVCFGGLSNTGITTGLAGMEAVKELGLDKVAIGCLGGLPTNVDPVYGKAEVAKKIITVDGCPQECSKKIVEEAGFELDESLILTRDIEMEKIPLHQDIEKGLKPMMEYISGRNVEKAKELIIRAIRG